MKHVNFIDFFSSIFQDQNVLLPTPSPAPPRPHLVLLSTPQKWLGYKGEQF